MAEVLMETLDLYGLKNKIMAVVADNASNNDTMIKSLEKRLKEEGIPFNASEARIWCLPHTLHLAAMKVSS